MTRCDVLQARVVLEASLFSVLWDKKEFLRSFKITTPAEVMTILSTQDVLRARCCVSTPERYYLIHPHGNRFADEEVNPEELGGWLQVSAKWQSWDENLTF